MIIIRRKSQLKKTSIVKGKILTNFSESYDFDWIPELFLSRADRAIAESADQWYNDSLIMASMRILFDQFSIGGKFMEYGLTHMTPQRNVEVINKPLIQPFHWNQNHWLVLYLDPVSNKIHLYDSMQTNVKSDSFECLKKYIAQYLQKTTFEVRLATNLDKHNEYSASRRYMQLWTNDDCQCLLFV